MPDPNLTEGSYIDYRRFDALNIEPRFEFGFGLTYTTSNYSDLGISHTDADCSYYPPPGEIMEGGLESLWDVVAVVTARVSNAGEVTASEVPQLHMGIPGAPAEQLRGFTKIPLEPDETKSVHFPLTRHDLSRWDTELQSCYLQRGEYKVYVGSSSRDIRLTGTLAF
ncbi:fibronectin type III-like domain-containing protein [Aspergillus alliaceus]|uniref:fibronectin type III-like domain-containing protein n=1 Tax=Petromyces alliaceus TaxID=209559 RepID=UPI0012A6DCAF|nr:fibronectin type III-like domain-containing protein [Aspergillus alliaceus]KAB8229655.1 fibronectin type III-like domain-containing protein [Aspergillus alliaceus]